MAKSIHEEQYRRIILRLRKARQAAGLTQKDVADKLGKPQSHISKIEARERRLDVMELKKLASIYRKPISFFIK